MSAGTLLLRCDATVEIGTGHFMRCLALAEAWHDVGGDAIFAMADTTPATEEYLRFEGFQLRRIHGSPGSTADSLGSVDVGRQCNASWIVVDGYTFGADYKAALKVGGFKVLLIDDDGNDPPYTADLVLNQNAHAARVDYRNRGMSTRLLLGTRYVLLRREFGAWRNWKRATSDIARKVLITMGGSDAGNVTSRVVEAISLQTSVEAVVVVGGSNPHIEQLRERIGGRGPIKLVENATNMPELMAWADMAISGGGTTCLELCTMGLPTIVTVLAENQRSVASELHKLGVVIDLGWGLEIPPERLRASLKDLSHAAEKRRWMSVRARELVDGYGVDRVLTFLLDEVRLRRTTEVDCRCFWEWANDSEVRKASFSRAFISWDEHCDWFRKRLKDPASVLYTAVSRDEVPIGTVRFRVNASVAVASISIDSKFRGHGYGRQLLFLATERVFEESNVECIRAYVKVSNRSSLRLFDSAGFRRSGVETIEGQDAVVFQIKRAIS